MNKKKVYEVYEKITDWLASFKILIHQQSDPDCGYATIWLAQKE